MAPANFYQNLFIALAGGVAGGILTLIARFAGEHYRAWVDQKQEDRQNIYEPLYNEITIVAGGDLRTGNRLHWPRIQSADKLRVNKNLREQLDQLVEKEENMRRRHNELFTKSGKFGEYLPDEITNVSSGDPDLRRGSGQNEHGHLMPLPGWTRNHEEILIESSSPEELQEAIIEASETRSPTYRETIEYWNENYPGWAEGIYQVTETDSFQQWTDLRQQIIKDAQELEPKLEYIVSTRIRRILLLPGRILKR